MSDKTDAMRKMAARLRHQAAVEKTLKTAQTLEAVNGLERLKRKLYR